MVIFHSCVSLPEGIVRLTDMIEHRDKTPTIAAGHDLWFAYADIREKKRPLVLRFAPHVTFRYSARHFSMVKYRGNDPHKTWPEMIADSYHFSYVLRPWAYMDEAWRLFGRSQWHCHDWVNF